MFNQNQTNIVQKLGVLFERESTRFLKKIVIVPSSQTGQELRVAIARAGYSAVNGRFSTVLSLASDLHEGDHNLTSMRRLSSSALRFLVASLMDQMPALSDSPLRKSASHVARTIADMRLSGITSGRFREVATSEHRNLISQIYQAYESHLGSKRLIDDAELYRRVTTGMKRGIGVSRPFVLLIVGSVQLSEVEFRFVRELARHSIEFSVLRRPGTSLPPFHLSASNRFTGVISTIEEEAPGPDQNASQREVPRLFRAVGPENEIRGVFQQIVERGLVLDEVEITYPVYDPYVRIVRSLANRYDIPITLAAGVPVQSTRSGMALKIFLEWMSGGYASDVLVEALRGRLIELGGRASRVEGEDRNTLVADYLSTTRIIGTPGVYVDHLERRIEIEIRGDSPFSDRAWKADTLRSVLRHISPLLSLADPDRVRTPRDLSDLVRRFLDRFVPTQRDLPEDHLEHVAKRELGSRFATMSEVIDVSIERVELLRLAIAYLGEHFVRARAAAPGAVHVVPLTSCGFSARPHTFVVGLDDTSFSRHTSDDPFFPDSDRELIEGDGSTRMSKTSGDARSSQWYLQSILSGGVGYRCLSYTSFDPADGREQFPSAALLEIMDKHRIQGSDIPVISWIPDKESTPCFLDRTDVFLALGCNTKARAELEMSHRNLEAGRIANRARGLRRWSPFDGVLVRNSVGPDLNAQAVSASRLETLFSCPFRFYLKYVLRATKPEEIDASVWISPLVRGRIVHEGLRRWVEPFIKAPGHESVDSLSAMFDSILDDYAALSAPPNSVEYERERHYFKRVSLLYMKDSTSNRADHIPFGVEHVVSSVENGAPDEEDPSVHIVLGNEHMDLKGRIDRIDVDPSSFLSITDYKTGSDSEFKSEDLLGNGAHLQWALYAYAAETMFGRVVSDSGYLFLNENTLGRRISGNPDLIRADVEMLIAAARRLYREEAFVQSGALTGVCSYCEFSSICGDTDDLKVRISLKLGATQTGTSIGDALSTWPATSRRLGGEQ